MTVLLFILGIIDIIGAVFIFLNMLGVGYGLYFLWIIALIHLIKGLFSVVSGGYFAAFIDLVSAFILLLSYLSIPMYYVLGIVIGILLLIKGFQSVIPFASEMING